MAIEGLPDIGADAGSGADELMGEDAFALTSYFFLLPSYFPKIDPLGFGKSE